MSSSSASSAMKIAWASGDLPSMFSSTNTAHANTVTWSLSPSSSSSQQQHRNATYIQKMQIHPVKLCFILSRLFKNLVRGRFTFFLFSFIFHLIVLDSNDCQSVCSQPCSPPPPTHALLRPSMLRGGSKLQQDLFLSRKWRKCLAQDDMVLYCKLFQREIMKLGNLSGQISRSHSH